MPCRDRKIEINADRSGTQVTIIRDGVRRTYPITGDSADRLDRVVDHGGNDEFHLLYVHTFDDGLKVRYYEV